MKQDICRWKSYGILDKDISSSKSEEFSQGTCHTWTTFTDLNYKCCWGNAHLSYNRWLFPDIGNCFFSPAWKICFYCSPILQNYHQERDTTAEYNFNFSCLIWSIMQQETKIFQDLKESVCKLTNNYLGVGHQLWDRGVKLLSICFFRNLAPDYFSVMQNIWAPLWSYVLYVLGLLILERLSSKKTPYICSKTFVLQYF